MSIKIESLGERPSKGERIFNLGAIVKFISSDIPSLSVLADCDKVYVNIDRKTAVSISSRKQDEFLVYCPEHMKVALELADRYSRITGLDIVVRKNFNR